MTGIYSKYFYMFTITMISLVLINGGCVYQPERIVTIETKMDTLSQSVEGMEPEISALKGKLDAQAAGIESTLSSQSQTYSHLEEGLVKTENMIQEIIQKLDSAEEEKTKMIAQLEELRSQLNKLESISKIRNAETNLTDELLNDAIKLYSEQKFEEAVSKWEEVLVLDPGNLDAKFNIEIAKDRIKEKQIHDEPKATLIQRK